MATQNENCSSGAKRSFLKAMRNCFNQSDEYRFMESMDSKTVNRPQTIDDGVQAWTNQQLREKAGEGSRTVRRRGERSSWKFTYRYISLKKRRFYDAFGKQSGIDFVVFGRRRGGRKLTAILTPTIKRIMWFWDELWIEECGLVLDVPHHIHNYIPYQNDEFWMGYKLIADIEQNTGSKAKLNIFVSYALFPHHYPRST
jgi:hypothetical protein